MKKLTIAVDFDDVLVPSAMFAFERYHRNYGFQIDPRSYYGKITKEAWGTDSLDEAVQRIGDALSDEDLLMIPPYKAAIGAVSRLSEQHKMYLVTGRSDRLMPTAINYVDKYFSGLFNGLINTNHYSIDPDKHRSKGDICREIGADVLVDDYIGHIESVMEYGLKEAIVIAQPWNEGFVAKQGIVRVVDWNEDEREINRIATA